MSPQDGGDDWDAERKRLQEIWDAETRPGLEAQYRRDYLTRFDPLVPKVEGDIPRSFPVLDDVGADNYAKSRADFQWELKSKVEEEKHYQKNAEKEAQIAADKEAKAQEEQKQLEDRSKQLAAEIGDYKNPKDIQAQSFAELRRATAGLNAEKPQEQAEEQAVKEQAEKDKLQQQGLAGGKTGEQNVAEVDQASQRDPTPTSMLHNQPPRDYSPLNETERQLAAQLAARQRDENFVETAREITERKIGIPLDGGGLEKSEEKQPIDAMQDQASNGKAEAEPDHLPDKKAYHEQMEKLSIDADTMDVALQEREQQQHEKALLEAEVRRGMETVDQNAVEEPQPALKTEIQFTSMESLAFDQKRNEEIIQDRESQEREKALEEIKRRLEQEAELRKELNRKKGLGLGD